MKAKVVWTKFDIKGPVKIHPSFDSTAIGSPIWPLLTLPVIKYSTNIAQLINPHQNLFWSCYLQYLKVVNG